MVCILSPRILFEWAVKISSVQVETAMYLMWQHFKKVIKQQNLSGTTHLFYLSLILAPEGPPQSVRAQSSGSQSLKVTWKPVDPNLSHGTITTYFIGYKQQSSDDGYQFKTYPVIQQSSQYTTYLTNLKPLTKYWIVVQPHNKAGAGPLSDPIVGITLETSPPISPVIIITATTNSSIRIRWEKDEKDRSIIKEFNLYFRDENKHGWEQRKINPSAREYELEGLLCGNKYTLYMTATNSLGTGEPSKKVSARTKGAGNFGQQHWLATTTHNYLIFGFWELEFMCFILFFSSCASSTSIGDTIDKWDWCGS